MKARKANIDWLSDVGVFRVNRLDAHSDHRYYETMEEAEAGADMTFRHTLNGVWKFSYAERPERREALFYEESYNSAEWSDIQVPGHIQLQGFGSPQYVNTMYPWDGLDPVRPPFLPQDNVVGSYVREFELPEQMKQRRVFVSFQGVEAALYVWLNGEFVGYAEDSFTPSEFELTPYIRDGKNRIAVEVYQRSTGSWLEDQDFWRFSGIFREVYLYSVPEVHVHDVSVRAELDDTYKQGTLKVDLTLLGLEQALSAADAGGAQSLVQEPSAGGEEELQADVREKEYPAAVARLELKDANGNVVVTAEGAFAGGRLQLSAAAGEVRLWSAERPYLYSVCISICNGEGRLVEAIVQKAGFRRFEMINQLMCLNGKRIVFKGVNRHEFNCRSGRHVSKEDMLWDIQTLKRNNMNAVRTSHYPNQTLWYELCDEYGVYVIDEMNLESHGSWQKMGAVEPSWNVPGNLPEWEPIVMDRAISMLERDKNHPSILIWSCGNEAYAGEVILNVSHYFRQTDPSRLVHYEGVFHNRDFDDTSDMESRMYAKPADIEAYLQSNPGKPYISCEYMHAMGNSVGGLHKYTELERKYPMYQGGFIWDYIDQSLVKQNRYGQEYLAYGGDFDDRPTDYSFCGNGLVFADRTITPKMQEVKYLYQNIKLEPQQDGVRIVNENLFEGTDGLLLQVKLYRDGEQVYANELSVSVAAGSEAFVPLELPILSGNGDSATAEGSSAAGIEYALHAAFVLREAELWAEAGHEVAFGENIFWSHEEQAVEGASEAAANRDVKAVRVVEGDVNIGVSGDGFAAIFSKQAGSLISLRYGGRELIAIPPAPLFWRATTDNDKGTALGYEAGVWYGASLARKCVKVELSAPAEDGSVTVGYAYTFSAHPGLAVDMTYTVQSDGQIRVRTAYTGVEGLADLPIFAVSFKLSADYSESEWLALGPEENYGDRAFGARLGLFRRKVAELPTPYLVPQESGNRTGVRRVSLTESNGSGLKLSALPDAPLEVNLSPYTAFELEHAAHAWELPAVHYTVVTVAGRQMGVGGDDSWGAPVHEEYRIPSNRNMAFEFILQGI